MSSLCISVQYIWVTKCGFPSRSTFKLFEVAFCTTVDDRKLESGLGADKFFVRGWSAISVAVEAVFGTVNEPLSVCASLLLFFFLHALMFP